MRAEGRERLPGAGVKTLLVLLLALCYLCGIREYLQIPESPAAAVLLTGNCPDGGRVKEILDTEADSDRPADSCFLYNGGIQSVSNEELGRRSDVLAIGLLGKNVLYDWRCQGLTQEDKEGCIIDKGTARRLFGGSDAVGNVLTLGDKKLTVRKVADWKQSMVVFCPSEKENLYTQVFVRPGKGESKTGAVQKFLMRYGLNGTLAENGPWKKLVFGCLILLPAAFGIRLFFAAFGERRKCKKGTREYWLWTGALFLPPCIFVFWGNRFAEIPRDWIPTRWSDFDFWGEKITGWVEGFRWYLLMPKTVWQAEAVLCALRGALFAVLSLLLYVFFTKRKE